MESSGQFQVLAKAGSVHFVLISFREAGSHLYSTSAMS